MKLKAKIREITAGEIELEFGRTQVEMYFSDRGKLARSLGKLKEGDVLEVTVKRV